MASSDSHFRNESPALWFGPRAHANPGPRRERLWLLWPAWAWRVAVPANSQRSLNVFQRAALALATAGLRDQHEIGERLGMHRDLAELVLLELNAMGLINARGEPSPRGLSALTEASQADRALTAAWVFQDPFTRELWPRTEAQLQYVERRFQADHPPQIVLGDSARPYFQTAVQVRPKHVVRPAMPSPEEVIRAIGSQRKARRRLSREEEEDFTDEGEAEVDHDAVPTGAVSFIDDEPFAVWLVAFAYFPRGAEGDGRWYVTDPFGMGPSERLRAGLERQRSQTEFLNRKMREFLGKRAEEDEDTARELGVLELEDRYGVGIHASPAYEALVDLHTALAAGDKLTPFGARGAYGALRRALEETFLPLAKGAPWQDLQATTPGGRVHIDNSAFIRQHLALCASLAGLAEPPFPVLKVSAGQVRSAAEYASGSLRARMGASLLNAARCHDHPLRLAAVAWPTLLGRVDALADAAGDAVHSKRFRFSRDRLTADVDALHDILRALSHDNDRSTGGY